MTRTLMCEVITPERIVYSNEVRMVIAMTTSGEIGILPLHAPLVTTLAAGEIRLRTGEGASDWETFSVAGGYLQVHEDKAIILADMAVQTTSVDVAKERENAERIRKALDELPADAVSEREECIRDLQWCELKLKNAEKKHH